MRIVPVCLSSGFAGTERSTTETCNAHAGDHDVCLVVRRGHRARNGASMLDFLDPRVRVVEVGNWFAARGLARAIAEFRPDVVHAHLRRATRLLARLAPPCATVATLHLWVNGPQFMAMDGLILISAWQRRDLGAYRGRVFEIPNSLVPHRVLPPAEVARLRAELGAGPGDFLVGGVGRLARSKGFDSLVRAFLAADPPGARLAIIGDGRERRRLERLARGRVRFTGFRANAKDYFQAFDLFVCPSRSEPMGRVILEALDAGTPVLATAANGPAEILGRYPGVLVPIDDVTALAAQIKQFAAARPPRLRPDLGPHDVLCVASRILAAYRELVLARASGLLEPAVERQQPPDLREAERNRPAQDLPVHQAPADTSQQLRVRP
jgi:glycosyltransferase involved in cell wall biosynthesis